RLASPFQPNLNYPQRSISSAACRGCPSFPFSVGKSLSDESFVPDNRDCAAVPTGSESRANFISGHARNLRRPALDDRNALAQVSCGHQVIGERRARDEFERELARDTRLRLG